MLALGDATKVWRTSLVTATCLLHELRTRFTHWDFQEQYQALQSKREMSFGKTHLETLQLTSSVQFAILPKYGFEASPRGLADMIQEMSFHAIECGDVTVKALMRDIHLLLGKRDIQWQPRQQERAPLFHTVGDSHSVYGWPRYVVRHHQGPMLCYNAHHIDLRCLTPPIQEGDAVCICLGEIDCRCHVHKHCTAETTFRKVIDGILIRYFEHLRGQVLLLPANVTVFIYNIVPPVHTQALQQNEKLTYPSLGSDEERRAYVLYFNQRLQSECAREGYTFFNVYSKYASSDGFLAPELSDGCVHIQDGRHIEAFLQKCLIPSTSQARRANAQIPVT